MSIDFSRATVRDFENIPGASLTERAELFYSFLEYMGDNGHMNYRLKNTSGCGPVMRVEVGGAERDFVSFVSNDYLGFTQHPEVKRAVLEAVAAYGTGAGASPLIGGHFSYHDRLERGIAGFFGREPGEAVIFTTGYTANSATLQALLQKEDLAVVDMSVHTSVYEGCILTNTKSFPHNNMEALDRILESSRGRYRNRLIVVDGVYSQDGDVAPLREVVRLARHHGAYLMVDDAHGIGVLGASGRGAMEEAGILGEVDFITGTFSKTFGNVGGYVIADRKMAALLKFQSRQQIFSATAPPSSAGIARAIELVDEEPGWRAALLENVGYFKRGLHALGLDTGPSCAAIVPVRIGDPGKTGDAGRMLLERGIYTNPILYPAVARKDARIRMAVMATHTREDLDRALGAFEDVAKKLHLATK